MGCIESQKIMDKWAKKYGISQIVQINDYIESINQYSSNLRTTNTI
ncbi:hypothetical protein [Aliarcobacter butzleri]